jgi:hypothetical protein
MDDTRQTIAEIHLVLALAYYYHYQCLVLIALRLLSAPISMSHSMLTFGRFGSFGRYAAREN